MRGIPSGEFNALGAALMKRKFEVFAGSQVDSQIECFVVCLSRFGQMDANGSLGSRC